MCSDLVTNSYGESWDLSCEKLRLPAYIHWVPVQKIRGPKLKNAWALVNQTVNLKKEAKTLCYWHHAKLHYNSFLTISDARYLPLSKPKTLALAPQCYSNAERKQITTLRLKAITKFINAVWLTFYWSPRDAWCFHLAEGLCSCGI